jgi:nucleotide-binding universal stress UspA family protein
VKTILAAVDFSGVTGAVAAEAATLAHATSGRVVLVSVVQPPAIVSEYAPLMENIATLQAAAEKSAVTRLRDLQRELEARQIASEIVCLTGSPIAHLVEQARLMHADYIVMGSHGHTALYDLLVGSTTHGVLMRANCPVVIVPRARDSK